MSMLSQFLHLSMTVLALVLLGACEASVNVAANGTSLRSGGEGPTEADPAGGEEAPGPTVAPEIARRATLRLIDVPTTPIATVDIALALTGELVDEYAYQLLSGETACDGAAFGNWAPISTPLQLSFGQDGPFTLCAKGRAAGGGLTSSVVRAVLISDGAPPTAPGMPTEFAVDPVDPATARLSWQTAAEDLGSGVDRQEVLLFDQRDPTCAGTPAATIPVAADATTATWSRRNTDLKGILRFRVKAYDRSGHGSLGPCSDVVSLRAASRAFLGAVDDQKLGTTEPRIEADITGDGIAEIISTTGPTAAGGGLSVLIGAVDPLNMKERLFTGDVADDVDFGFSLGSIFVADVTDDGYQDVVVVSPFSTVAGQSLTGQIFILPGGPTLPPSQSFASVGVIVDGVEEWEATCFLNVSFIDITKDGITDVVCGSSYAGTSKGAIYVVPGRATWPARALLTDLGMRYLGSDLSLTISQVVDLDEDGFLDIVATQSNGASDDTLILLAGTSLPPSQGIITAASRRYTGAGFGAVVDLDKDGHLDVISKGSSTVYVFSDGRNLPASGTVAAQASRAYTYNAGSGGGGVQLRDVNDDGYLDLLWGGGGTNNRGIIFVLPAVNPLPASNTVANVGRIYQGALDGDYFRLSGTLAFADLTGDGVKEMVFSNGQSARGGANAGAVFVLLGVAGLPASGNIDALGRVYRGDAAGQRLAGFRLGDVTGDGLADIVAFDYDDQGQQGLNAGKIFVLPGSTSPLPASNAISAVARVYEGDAPDDMLGSNIELRDVTGDSQLDILSWNRFAKDGDGYQKGSIYVVRGGNSLPASGLISTIGYRLDGSAEGPLVGLTSFDGDNDGVAEHHLAYGSELSTEAHLDIVDGPLWTGAQPHRLLDSRWGDYYDGYHFWSDMTGDGKAELIVPAASASSSGLSANGALTIIPAASLLWP